MKIYFYLISVSLIFLSCKLGSIDKELKRDQDAFNFLLLGLFDLSSRGTGRDLEIYDFKNNRFSNTNMKFPRFLTQPASARLADGRVLISGGTNSSGDGLEGNFLIPKTLDQIREITQLPSPRIGHTITELSNGMVTVIDGATRDKGGSFLEKIELININSNTIINVATLNHPRYYHSVLKDPSGKIFILGGLDSNLNFVAEIEVYDSNSHTVDTIGQLATPRGYFTPVIHNDHIYIIGGLKKINNQFAFAADVEKISIEDYSIMTLQNLKLAKADYQMMKLGNSVSLIGGRAETNRTMNRIETYDFETEVSQVTGELLNYRNPKCLLNHRQEIYLAYGTENNQLTVPVLTKLDITRMQEQKLTESAIFRKYPTCLSTGNSRYLIFGG